MSTDEKVELVASVWESHGLAPALAAVELPKSTWYYHRNQKVSYTDKYAHLRPLLEEIVCDHSDYGIPRITVELREQYNQHINHKVVQRLLKEWDLSLLRNVQSPQPSGIRHAIVAAGRRANLVAQMESIGLFDVAYTDFTQLRYANGARKAYLMPIIGHECKLVYGWAVGPSANTTLALRAWEKAKQTFQNCDICWHGMVLHHDQDSVYTGYRWTEQLLRCDRVRLSYALEGARDNPEMESFHSRFKNENRSLLLDAQTLDELRRIVAERMRYHNQDRRHSSLSYVPPRAYIRQQRQKEAISASN